MYFLQLTYLFAELETYTCRFCNIHVLYLKQKRTYNTYIANLGNMSPTSKICLCNAMLAKLYYSDWIRHVLYV
jgi:hypothetical protein